MDRAITINCEIRVFLRNTHNDYGVDILNLSVGDLTVGPLINLSGRYHPREGNFVLDTSSDLCFYDHLIQICKSNGQNQRVTEFIESQVAGMISISSF